MQLTVKGKHLDVGDALREHVQTNLNNTAEKYFRDAVEATVTFTKEKNHRYRADISLHVGRGVVLESQFEADDPYPAFDEASKRVATRLSRYKDRVRDHHRKDSPADVASYTAFESSNENEAENAEQGGGAIIAEMELPIMTLAVSDAVWHLELRNVPALMFKNPSNGGYNMVYRRADGNIGWVDPVGDKKISETSAARKPTAKKPAPAKAKAAKKPAKKSAPKAVKKSAQKTAKKAAKKTPAKKQKSAKKKTKK